MMRNTNLRFPHLFTKDDVGSFYGHSFTNKMCIATPTYILTFLLIYHAV